MRERDPPVVCGADRKIDESVFHVTTNQKADKDKRQRTLNTQTTPHTLKI